MLNKLILVNRINKFYDIFGEVLNYYCKLTINTINYDTLTDVLFDINEILGGYNSDETDEMYIWLESLESQINNFRGKKFSIKKVITTTLMVLLGAYIGWVVLSIADILAKNLSDYNFFMVFVNLFQH